MPTFRALVGVAGLAAGLVLVPSVAASAASNIIVGNRGSCPGAQYSTISAAVAVAQSGDTISVCRGIYPEHVVVNTPGLTFLGVKAGTDGTTRRNSNVESIVTSTDGSFTLGGSADDTTIDGFTLSGSTVDGSDAVSAFAGSSGLTFVNNVVKLNANGIFLQNPNGAKPGTISQNLFANNNSGGPVGDGNTGSGVFICCGPARNLAITDNTFIQHTQTAINFAGDGGNHSTGLVVTGNLSSNDSTFVVATNSDNAVIEDNTVRTSNAALDRGTAILDFGANNNLRIGYNTMKATGSTSSTGISVSNAAGSSVGTTVVGNSVTGWFNNIRVSSGNTSAYVSNNQVFDALNDGILALAGTSGVVFSHNVSNGSALYACEDQTTGHRTAGTDNVWSRNRGNTASSPAGICTAPPV